MLAMPGGWAGDWTDAPGGRPRPYRPCVPRERRRVLGLTRDPERSSGPRQTERLREAERHGDVRGLLEVGEVLRQREAVEPRPPRDALHPERREILVRAELLEVRVAHDAWARIELQDAVHPPAHGELPRPDERRNEHLVVRDPLEVHASELDRAPAE